MEDILSLDNYHRLIIVYKYMKQKVSKIQEKSKKAYVKPSAKVEKMLTLAEPT